MKNETRPFVEPPPSTRRADNAGELSPQDGDATLPEVLADLHSNLSRADVSAAVPPVLLVGIAQALTQVSSMPPAAFSFLKVAAGFALLTLAAAAWVIVPRRLGTTPELPGSFLHALNYRKKHLELLAAYRKVSSAEIRAAQLAELAGVAKGKWRGVRWTWPPFAAAVLTLFVMFLVVA